MAHIKILVGSVFGNTLSLAEECAEALKCEGHDVKLLKRPNYDLMLAGETDVLLVCTSTTGMGEIPDSLQNLFHQVQERAQPLPHLRYGLINVGDSNYEAFAEAGWLMDGLFRFFKLQRVGEPLVIDTSEVQDLWEVTEDWLGDWSEQL